MINAEIVEVEVEDRTGNILIFICLTDKDGKEWVVNSNQGAILRNGRNVWPIVCGYHNFKSRTPAEQLEWVKLNAERQIGTLIQEIAKPLVNPDVITELKKLKGTIFSKDSVSIEVSMNGTAGKRTLIVKDDGTCICPEAEATETP